MGIMKDTNMKLRALKNNAAVGPSLEEDEEVEQDIASVLLFSGYEPNTPEWTEALLNWKRRRSSNPRAYKKFMDLD
jgi:hypothetical protein